MKANKYFIDTENNLYLYNMNSDTYIQENKLKDRFISKEDFAKLNTKQVNKTLYRSELHKFFDSVKHSWNYNGTEFKKSAPLLEVMSKLPKHNNGWGIPGYTTAYLCYYLGNVYFYTMYKCMSKGFLLNPTTKKQIKWVSGKHLFAIQNKTTHDFV